jgi:hypothetical protein
MKYINLNQNIFYWLTIKIDLLFLLRENSFFLQSSKKRDIYASLLNRKVCHF